MTISTALPSKWSDQQDFNNNGTIQNWFNSGWLNVNARVGVLDLKAPDVLYPGAHFLWNPTPTIPAGATITSASFAGGADDNAFFQGVLDTAIEVVDKDGRWDIQPTKAAHWVAGDPAATLPVHVEVHVFDGATEIAATGATAGGLAAPWPVRRWGVVESPATARNQKIGQTLTVAIGGTLTSASIRANKVDTGGLSGDCWLEVWSIVGGLPSVLLATSDTRPATSVSAASALEVFTFSGGDQITQTLGTQYAYVLTGDWTVNFVDYLQVRVLSAVLATDRFPVVYGESRGLDSNNYILASAPGSLPLISGSPSVAWAPPVFVEDVVYTSADIASLIQAWVDDPSYVAGEPILIRWRPTNPAQLFLRGFKTWVNADTPGVVQQVTLTVDWEAPVAVDTGIGKLSTIRTTKAAGTGFTSRAAQTSETSRHALTSTTTRASGDGETTKPAGTSESTRQAAGTKTTRRSEGETHGGEGG